MIGRMLFLTLIGLILSACSMSSSTTSETQGVASPSALAATPSNSPLPGPTQRSATAVVLDFTQTPEFNTTLISPDSDTPALAASLTTTPEETQPPGGQSITIKSADGLEIAASFYAPWESEPPWPGVILLHMIYGSRADWEGPAQALAFAGYAVLSVDMRGHGDTGGEADWTQTASDLKQVWQYFAERPEVDETRTAFIGASMGANMALWAAAEETGVRTVVLLSPGLSYFGVEADRALDDYIQRTLMIIASSEDTYSAESSQKLAWLAGDLAELVMYNGAGHGTDMFDHEDGLIDVIIQWLDRGLN